MKDILLFFKKVFWRDSVLLGVVFILLILLFGGFISDNITWGWNTLPHFFATTQMSNFISSGSFSGYSFEWFGGTSLFVLYPPLIHGIITLLHFLLSFVSLEWFFSFILFCSLPMFVVSLWYVSRTFFDENVGKVSILLSLVFILFPGKLHILGIGATGAFFMGFFNSVWGISFALLSLAFLKKLYESGDRNEIIRNGIIFSFFLALTFLTHTLSFIGLLFFVVLFSLFHLDIRYLLYSLCSFLGAFLLTSFFSIPFFSNLFLSSGSAEAFDKFGGSPLFYTFAFDFSFLRDFAGTSFSVGGFVFFLLFLVGSYFSIKKRRYDMIFFWGISAIVFGTTYGMTMFPSLPIHYYRFMPFLLSFALVITSFGIVSLWKEKMRRQIYIQGILVVSVVLVVLFPIISIHIGGIEREFKEGIIPYTSSYSPRGEEYIHYKAASDTLAFMKDLPVQRFFSESSSVGDLGTPHYFTTMGPLKNDQASLFGLFVESSPQAPFFIPTFEGLMGARLDWGDDRLSEKIDSFLKQPTETFVDRLGYFGVSHIVVVNQRFRDRLDAVDNVAVATSSPYYEVRTLTDYKPLVYASDYTPGVYMDLDDTLPFRDIALSLFENPDTYNLPVVEWDRDLSDFKEVAEHFSFLAVSADGLSDIEKRFLEDVSIPLILLNPSERINHPQRYNIYNFEPLSYNTYYPSVPDASFAWKQFQEKVGDLIIERDPSPVSVFEMNNTTISFSGSGPIIINGGYFPYWSVVSSCDSILSCSVWQVSPSLMLVFSDGETTLSYISPYTWWGIVSLLFFILLLGGLWVVRK